MTRHVEARSGQYFDSVILMQTSRALSTMDGVSAALVAMGTELNLELLGGMGFDVPAAGRNDLVVAVDCLDEPTLQHALQVLAESLAGHAGRQSGSLDGELPPAPTVGTALRRSTANLVLVSVPGPSAYVEALDALHADRHVMVFSDNVPVREEIALKEEGARRGLLVMGPDCGTAIVQGVALGFANVVRPGGVGIVAASGTGAQQVSALLDAAGLGLSHLLGVGGRDLSADVGGRATLQAMRMLDTDPATERIVVVSKPAAAEVAKRVTELADELETPVHLAVLGAGEPDLTAATELVIGAAGIAVPEWPELLPAVPSAPLAGRLAGLFAGGTLAGEALVIASRLGAVRTNIGPDADLEPAEILAAAVAGHLVVDFGDDALTAGRAHPMIDPTLRLESLARYGGDSATAVVLLDVVLGFAADPDPAATLAPAIELVRRDGREPAIIVSLCGTEGDPQSWSAQAAALAAAGAEVYLSNAAAARRAVTLAMRIAGAAGAAR